MNLRVRASRYLFCVITREMSVPNSHGRSKRMAEVSYCNIVTDSTLEDVKKSAIVFVLKILLVAE